MTTRVEFYAELRTLMGAAELEFSLPEGASVTHLLETLYSRQPALAGWDDRLVLAAGLDHVERSHVIQPGEIISVMPPVREN